MKVCKVAGCGGEVEARGYCQKHYIRFRKYGSPEGFHPRHKRKIRWLESNSGHSGDECLTWPFSVGDHGRGTVTIDGRTWAAPRYMCLLARGAPPSPGHHAAHTCGNGHQGCVNPRHLVWKTPKENEADKVAHGTIRRGTAVNTNKIDEADVRKIREMILAGERGVDIARRYGITPAMVSRIKKRQAWAWLDDD